MRVLATGRYVSQVGIEPTTRGLKVPCSTTELLARIWPDSISKQRVNQRTPPSPTPHQQEILQAENAMGVWRIELGFSGRYKQVRFSNVRYWKVLVTTAMSRSAHYPQDIVSRRKNSPLIFHFCVLSINIAG
jgi:hypothetical protein